MSATTFHVTGDGLLELDARRRRGELVILGMEAGQAVVVGRDKRGRAKTRRDPAGWTVSVEYKQAPQPAWW